MTALTQLSAHPLVHALGWALLHFIWQGAIVALLLACVLGLLPSRASRLRYAAACAAMALMLALPLITFAVLAARAQPQSDRLTAALSAANAGLVPGGDLQPPATPWPVRCERALNRLLPAVIGLWLVGILLLVCRLNLGLMATRKLQSLAVEPAPGALETMLRALRIRLGIERTIRLLHSTRVQAPTVIGWLRPVILIPLGCVTGLSTAQIEAILAHELAHIRRHDYLVNLVQSVLETVLFYHPAVWWVSSRIRREREHCCDDLAIAICGDRLAYARALSALEERRHPDPAGAFAANGGALKTRIARVLGVNQATVFPRTAALTLLLLAGAAAGLAALGAARAQSATSAPGSYSQTPSAAQLLPAYAQWLNQDVRWIITPEEKQVFLRLKTGQERDEFIRQFWQRRNPNPGSPVNTYRQEHYRRIAYANKHFAVKDAHGWATDRGHVYIVFGPPDSIDSHPSDGSSSRPFEVWRYRSIRLQASAVKNPDASGYEAGPVVTRTDIDFHFVDECGCGDYRLRSPWPSPTAGQGSASPFSTLKQPSATQSPDTRIQVRKLTLVSTDLPEAERLAVVRAIEGHSYPAASLAPLIRQQLRARGYITSRVEVQNLSRLQAVPPDLPVDVSANVSAGAQYTIAGIVVHGARVFSQKQILQQFPIHPGDIFNSTEIASGLDRLKKLYAAKGYTRFGAIVGLRTDPVRHSATLTLSMDEGSPNPA